MINSTTNQPDMNPSIADLVFIMAESLDLRGDIEISSVNEYNAKQFEVHVTNGSKSFDFDVNLYENSICEITLKTRKRSNYINL